MNNEKIVTATQNINIASIMTTFFLLFVTRLPPPSINNSLFALEYDTAIISFLQHTLSDEQLFLVILF